MGDVIVSRRDRRRRAVSQRILVSTDLDRLRRCGHRVNGIILSCGSVWACPVCSARIRHAWLRDIMSTVEVAGQTVMLTCSLPADETDLLAPLLDMLLRSWSKVINGQPWKRAERRWHIGGFHACGRSDAQRSGMARADSRADDASPPRLDESERRAFLCMDGLQVAKSHWDVRTFRLAVRPGSGLNRIVRPAGGWGGRRARDPVSPVGR